MTRTAEVYCYHDKRYAHDLSSLLDDIRAAGHRVLTGGDAAELTMLLQVGLPTAVIYTLAEEESLNSPEFQMAARRAMDRWLPFILVGPGPISESLSLRLPESSGVMERHLSVEEVPELIGELADLNHQQKPALVYEDDGDDSDLSGLDDSMVDTVGDPDEQIRIETRIVVGDKARILTSITREGAVLIQEENDIPADEVDLFGRMEAQHLSALAAYSPQIEVSIPAPVRSTFKGEVSAPFFFDESLRREHVDKELEQRVRKISLALSAATIVAAVTTIAATLLWDLPIPRPITPALADVASSVHSDLPNAPAASSRASARLEQLRKAYMWPPEAGVLSSESMVLDDGSSGEVEFPGRFEIGSTQFTIKDPDASVRFISTIKTLSTAHDIWIVGHATHEEVGKGLPQIAKQRAVEVLRYLCEFGVPKERLHAVRGEPVALSADLEPNGAPRQHFVGIIIED
ncbi:MAG: hypothetical protein MUC50_18330 [Myxococcota bacterium]|jgi:hypothetical protein|nr:hypothetical protein [Myxococcota bacterium]